MRAIYVQRLSAETDASYEDAGLQLTFRDYATEDWDGEDYSEELGEVYDHDSSGEYFPDDSGNWVREARSYY